MTANQEFVDEVQIVLTLFSPAASLNFPSLGKTELCCRISRIYISSKLVVPFSISR